jgi:hypothetical protein
MQKGILLNTTWEKTGARGEHRDPSPERIYRSTRAAHELASKKILLALALLNRASFHLARRCSGRGMACRRPEERAGVSRGARRIQSTILKRHKFRPLSIQLRLWQDVHIGPYSFLQTLRSILFPLQDLPLPPETLTQLLVHIARILPIPLPRAIQLLDPLRIVLDSLLLFRPSLKHRESIFPPLLALQRRQDRPPILAFPHPILAVVPRLASGNNHIRSLLGISLDLYETAASHVLELELPDGRAVVGADLLLLGVEAHALADDGVRFAGVAPDCEGQFEAHCLRAVFAKSAWRAFLVQTVPTGRTFEVRRDVTSHVEALHFGGGTCRRAAGLGGCRVTLFGCLLFLALRAHSRCVPKV